MNVTGFSSPGSGTLGLTAFASTTPNTLLGTNNLGTYQNIGLPAGVFTINSANYLNYPSSNRRLLGSFSFSNASATHQSTLVLGSEYLSPYHALEIYIDGGITTANENTLLFSSNGGVSYITSAGSYVYSDIALCGLGTVSTVWQYEVSDTRVPLTYDASAQSGGSNIAGDNSNTGNLFTRIFITNHNSNTQPTYFRLDTDEYVYNGGGSEQFFRSYKTGVLSSAGITNAVKLTLNDYNTNGGVFVEVYGITNVT
jgi:hypothetical protein